MLSATAEGAASPSAERSRLGDFAPIWAQDDFLRPHSPITAPRRLRGRPRRPHGSRDRGRRRPRPGPPRRRRPRRRSITSRLADAGRDRSDARDPRPQLPASAATRTPSCSSARAARPSSSRPTSARRKLLRVTVPAKLAGELATRPATPCRRASACASSPRSSASASPRRSRVSAACVGARSCSPDARPRPPPSPAADGDCDGDGVELNSVETDDDKRSARRTDDRDCASRPTAVQAPTRDGDGVDGRLRVSSRRATSTTTSTRSPDRPALPRKRPYPNPLFADAGVDYDGDSLTLGEEYRAVAGRYARPRTASTR